MASNFLSKSSKFCIFLTIRFGSNFTSMWTKHVSNNVGRDIIRLPMLTFGGTEGKRRLLTLNLLQKFIFSDGKFYFTMVTITNADIGSVNFLHTLFDKYLDHTLVKLNKIVQSIHNFALFGKKWLTIFRKCWRHFGRRSCDINNNSTLKYKFEDYHLSLFQKLW